MRLLGMALFALYLGVSLVASALSRAVDGDSFGLSLLAIWFFWAVWAIILSPVGVVVLLIRDWVRRSVGPSSSPGASPG